MGMIPFYLGIVVGLAVTAVALVDQRRYPTDYRSLWIFITGQAIIAFSLLLSVVHLSIVTGVSP